MGPFSERRSGFVQLRRLSVRRGRSRLNPTHMVLNMYMCYPLLLIMTQHARPHSLTDRSEAIEEGGLSFVIAPMATIKSLVTWLNPSVAKCYPRRAPRPKDLHNVLRPSHTPRCEHIENMEVCEQDRIKCEGRTGIQLFKWSF